MNTSTSKIIEIIKKTGKVSKTNLKLLCNDSDIDFDIIKGYLSKDKEWEYKEVDNVSYYIKKNEKSRTRGVNGLNFNHGVDIFYIYGNKNVGGHKWNFTW